ncbi:MAG: acylneuraminate cytidylyltransferase family protein [Gammaproteobacteria bacterium]|nr:MAG: acylneuraminate cytidylyltransferase family protein [Gammaproteobacteria bacterium]
MISHGFVFARGGSKGLPGKNIKPLAGKPLIAYSIETAKQVSGLDKVFVSTDDKDIASIALEYGAVVIERPEELSGDNSPEWLAWSHAIDWVIRNYGVFKGFVSLPATSPLRSVIDVELAMDRLVKMKGDICISVTPANRSPFFNMVKKNSAGFVELVNKPNVGVYRRQDAPIVFDISTVVYATTCEFIKNNSGIFDGNVVCIEVPKERAVDIDDIYDFKLAEAILTENGTSHA